ncbi:hypothetical protein RZS08_29400, partial [Arthrospira platensis SPKY1]|nr:hypothetical protein [Arthrospira platensis SPKY1]
SSGKFDKKIKLTAPEDEQRIGIIVGVEQIDQENYIVISSINEKGKTISDTEICIVNIVTERVRKFELGTKDKNDIPSGHSWDGKHLLIGSAVFEKPFNILNPYQIRNAQCIIYKT